MLNGAKIRLRTTQATSAKVRISRSSPQRPDSALLVLLGFLAGIRGLVSTRLRARQAGTGNCAAADYDALQ